MWLSLILRGQLKCLWAKLSRKKSRFLPQRRSLRQREMALRTASFYNIGFSPKYKKGKEKSCTFWCYALKIFPPLLPGVNFINAICMNFLYKCCFGSFFSSYVYVEKAAETTFKIRTYNVDEIDGSHTLLQLWR